MKSLDTIFSTLDDKIKNLQIFFKEYREATLSSSKVGIVSEFEYTEKNILSIPVENASVIEALNLYIQKRVEVISLMSLIVKHCLSYKDFLNKTEEIITYLEKTYDEKSEYQLVYSDCYLNSSLAALNIARIFSFDNLLSHIKANMDNDFVTAQVPDLQMRNALTFKILVNSPVDVEKIIDILEEGEFDITTVIFKAIEDAHNINSGAADNFVLANKKWLEIDIKSNLAVVETDEWTILDHMNSPYKKVENNKINLHQNLLSEYSDMLKIFKDVQSTKTILDVSSVTEDFKNLSSNFNISSMMKESLNLSKIPLVVDIEDIISANDEGGDIIKLMGNSNNEAE